MATVTQASPLSQNPTDQTTGPTFFSLASEVRLLIYHHVFLQPNSELLALSREPEHDFDNGPPSDWIADSRQVGLVYGSDTARLQSTQSHFLLTCRLINKEATPVFYGANKIILYAEDNNDIFYWLLDIGEHNRRAIRYLEISWAYGVSIESGRGNIHGILETIENMEDSMEEEIQLHRQQLIHIVQKLERKTVKLIIRTLNLLVSNQDLISLAVYLPGVDGGDIWDLHNDNLYFAEEIFSNSTENAHSCVPKALSKMVGIKTLTIGYTKDIELAEQIALSTGAKELEIRTCPEGKTLMLNQEERELWLKRGWELEGKIAHKTLIADVVDNPDKEIKETVKQSKHKRKKDLQRSFSYERYSEGGRLKAEMMPVQHEMHGGPKSPSPVEVMSEDQ